MSSVEIDFDHVHPTLQQWLESEKADATRLEKIMRDIREGLFDLLLYHQFHLCEESVDIEFDREEGVIVFKNAARPYDLSLPSGNCFDLTTKAYFLIQKKYPELKDLLIPMIGAESRFYQGGDHAFLLVSPRGLLEDGRSRNNLDFTDPELFRPGFEYGISSPSYVVDPSLRVLGMIESLRYDLHDFLLLISAGSDHLLEPSPQATPFCIANDGRQIQFAWDRNPRSGLIDRLRINVQNPGEPFCSGCSIYDSVLEREFPNDSILLEQIRKLREKMSPLQP